MAKCDMQSHKGEPCVCSGCPERETPGSDECDACIICTGPHVECPLLESEDAKQQESPTPAETSTRGDGICTTGFYKGDVCVCFGCIHIFRCEYDSGCKACSGPPTGCRSACYQ